MSRRDIGEACGNRPNSWNAVFPSLGRISGHRHNHYEDLWLRTLGEGGKNLARFFELTIRNQKVEYVEYEGRDTVYPQTTQGIPAWASTAAPTSRVLVASSAEGGERIWDSSSTSKWQRFLSFVIQSSLTINGEDIFGGNDQSFPSTWLIKGRDILSYSKYVSPHFVCE